jgi:hypothetical protein
MRGFIKWNVLEVIMSYLKIIVMGFICAVFQDGIQAAHMTRVGLTYARTRINLNSLHYPRLRTGRSSIDQGSRVHLIESTAKPIATDTIKTHPKSKDIVRSLLVETQQKLDRHKENLMNMTAIIASLNIEGLDLTDLLTLKEALRSDPFTIAFAAKLKFIIAKQKSPKLRSKS